MYFYKELQVNNVLPPVRVGVKSGKALKHTVEWVLLAGGH